MKLQTKILSFWGRTIEKKKNLLIAGVFGLLVFLFYGNTLFNGFVYDDIQQVRDNDYVHSFRYIPKVITGCIWEFAVGECRDSVAYYRPIQSLSYLLTWQISSSPWLFHLVNLIYFTLVVFFSYVLVHTLTKNRLLALGSAFLALLHPLNTEVVVWPSAVPELTYVLFCLLGTLFYVRFRSVDAGSQTRAFPKNFLLAVLFYFLAMLSKEPAVFLPGIFAFLDLFVFKIPFSRLFSFRELKRYIAMVGTFFIYLGIRMIVFHGTWLESTQDYGSFTIGERVHAFFTLFAQYMGALAYPYPLNFYHLFDKQSNFFTLQFFVAFLAGAGFLAAIWFFIRKQKPMYSFFLVWMMVFLVPPLVALNHVGENIFSERYTFASSIGYAFFISVLAILAWQKKGYYRVAVGVFLVLVIGASFTVIQERILAWRDNETLYLDTLAKTPEAHAIRFNYGVLLRTEKKDFEAARAQFEKIVQDDEEWRDTGMVYLHLGDYERDVRKDEKAAFAYYRQAIEAAERKEDWKGAFAYDRIGAMYAAKEEYLSSLPFFCMSSQGRDTAELATARDRFSRVQGILQEMYQDNADLLYHDLKSAEGYRKAEEAPIQFTQKKCQEKECTFAFSFRSAGTEIIFPFLIVAVDQREKSVPLLDAKFDPATSDASFTTAASTKNSTLTFLFPSCHGLYYEAITNEKP